MYNFFFFKRKGFEASSYCPEICLHVFSFADNSSKHKLHRKRVMIAVSFSHGVNL